MIPAFEVRPDGDRAAAAEACELMAECGMPLDAWQERFMHTALARADDRWAATEVGLVVPRQNGKGTLLEAKALHALFRTDAKLVMWSAHEFKTAQEGFLRVKDLIEGNKELRRRVKSIRVSHVDVAVDLHDGSRLKFFARSRGSGRGFSPDVVILDEAYSLTVQQMAAILPSMSARPDPQVWYTSSAPLDVSEVLVTLMRRGRGLNGSQERLAYAEYCAPDDALSDDREALSAANPALEAGRMRSDFLDTEYQTMGDTREYRRERLGIVDLGEARNPAINTRAWSDCGVPGELITSGMSWFLAVASDGSHATLSAANRDGDHVRVEPMREWESTRTIRRDLQALITKWQPRQVSYLAAGPAAAIGADLKALEGVTIKPTPATEARAICMGLADLVSTRQLRHGHDPALSYQAGKAERKRQGDGWVFEDMAADVLMSAAGAAHLARGQKAQRQRRSRSVMRPGHGRASVSAA